MDELNDYGQTPLSIAVQDENMSMIELLLHNPNHPSDVNIPLEVFNFLFFFF